MAKNWPQLSKLKHPLRRDTNILFITVETKMFCGTEITQNEECPRNKEFSTKDKLSDRVTSIGNVHIKNCNTCKKHYG